MSKITKILLIVSGLFLLFGREAFAWGIPGLSGDPFIPVTQQGGTIEEQTRGLAYQIYSILKIIISGIALVFIVIIGVKMIVFSDSEDRIKTQKKQINYALIGFLFLNIPGVIYEFFEPTNTLSLNPGNFTSVSSCIGFWRLDIICSDTGIFGNLLNFFRVFIFGAAVLMFTWAAFALIINSGNEERIKKAKNKFIYGILALIFLGFTQIWSKMVAIGNFTGEVSTVGKKIVGVAMFFAGPVAIFFLILGAYYYITSAGDEERVKKGKSILLNTFIATIILLASYTFLNDLLNFIV